MEPQDPNKKLEDFLKNLKNISFSYQTFPIHTFKHTIKQETAEEMSARLDEVDEMVDTMTNYPQAKKMLDKLYGKL